MKKKGRKMSIIKIVIKGCSGYVPVDAVYDDKLTLTPTSFSYEYKPYLESELNRARKWSYKTNSPLFAIGFERVADMLPSILEAEDTFFCTDVGMIDFTVTYEDKSRKHIRYWCTSDYFAECFTAINDLVPKTEMRPEVTRLYSEDLEEE